MHKIRKVSKQLEPTTGLKKLSEDALFKDAFLSATEDNGSAFVNCVETYINRILRPGLECGRRPLKRFSYKEEASNSFFPEEGLAREALVEDIASYFDGSVRWHNPNAALNITPTPHFDTVAVTAIGMLLNQNCLWDMTAGRLLLAEQRLVRALGKEIFQSESVEGFSTFGGKGTLFYGIKCGLANCDPSHKTRGTAGQYAVFASDRAHYSLEDVADYLGIGSSAIHRIPTDVHGCIDVYRLCAKMEQCLARGMKIAAIIANGGVTIDFCVDDILEIKRICQRAEEKHRLEYKIHIHGDLVAGWAWLFADEQYLDQSVSSKRIREAKNCLKNFSGADTVGVDFHKTGLCPYNTSFILLRDYATSALGGYLGTQKAEPKHGELRTHQITLENSRSSSGILAAYAIMMGIGKRGLTRYLKYQLDVRHIYELLIQNEFSDTFRVINQQSCGFEAVVTAQRVDGLPLSSEDYRSVIERIWNNQAEVDQIMVGYVPCYQTINGDVTAFLIYPMSPHSDEMACRNFLEKLKQEVHNLEKPVLPDRRLSQAAPPR